MTIEMEDGQIRRHFDMAYSELRSQFINISKPHLTASIINLLKIKYSNVINSARTSDYINSIESLLRILEKRGVLSYDNIEVLKYISENHVRDNVLERALRNYEGQRLTSLPPYNRYLTQSAGASHFKAQPGTSGLETIYNNASQVHRQPIQMTLYTTQPAFKITLPGSIDIGSMDQNPAHNESEIMTKVFLEISEKLGKHWRNVARHLGVTEYDIDEIDNQLNLSLNEKAFKALLKFQSKYNLLQWKPKLKHALDKARRRDLMELVDELSSRK